MHGAPEIREKISRIVFFGSGPGEAGTAWNTQRDRAAVEKMSRAGLRVFFIHTTTRNDIGFDVSFFRKIDSMHTPASGLLIQLHKPSEAKKKLESGFQREQVIPGNFWIMGDHACLNKKKK